jgi:hypothetical protein
MASLDSRAPRRYARSTTAPAATRSRPDRARAVRAPSPLPKPEGRRRGPNGGAQTATHKTAPAAPPRIPSLRLRLRAPAPREHPHPHNKRHSGQEE